MKGIESKKVVDDITNYIKQNQKNKYIIEVYIYTNTRIYIEVHVYYQV